MYSYGEAYDPEHVHGNIVIPPASAVHLLFSIWQTVTNTSELITQDRVENKENKILSFMEVSANDKYLIARLTNMNCYPHIILFDIKKIVQGRFNLHSIQEDNQALEC